MKKLILLAFIILANSLCVSAVEGNRVARKPQQAWYKPSAETLQSAQEFQQMRFGIFLHWGIYSMPAQGEWALYSRKYLHDEYKNLARGFYPAQFNADEWVKIFKNAGAKYITFTTRHHDGFSMFKTNYSPYNIVDATPFKRDIVGELAKACHNNDMRLHFYYSHLDWGRDDYWPLGRTGGTTGRDPQKHGEWKDYLSFMNNQLTELLTNYGKIGCIWFDGIWDKDEIEGGLDADTWQLDEQYKLIHRLQPNCLIGNNHHNDLYEGEDIQIFECDVPGENTAGLAIDQKISNKPLETCQTMNNTWGYNMSDRDYKSANDLIRYLVQTAGRDANLLLNIGPRPDGTLPPEAIARLDEMGKWLKVYGETIYGTRGGIVPPHAWGATTQKDNVLYVHVLFPSDKALFVPYSGNKLLTARMFNGKQPVKFIQTTDGVLLTFSEPLSEVDNVVELTYKNPIK